MYYSKLKIFKHPEKLSSLTHKITPPVHVRIKPTNRCNHNCSYCSYQNSYGQLGKDMVKQDEIPWSKMYEIIGDLGSMGTKAVTFSGGGEPLLYPNFGKLLRWAERKMVHVAILTNGVLLKGDLQKEVMDCCSWIRISMDGWDSESYAQYRGCRPSDFDQLIQNIQDLMSYESGCVVGVNIIVDDKNANHIYNMVRMVHDLGIRSIKISPCIISNDTDINNDFHDDIIDRVQYQIQKLQEAGIQVYDSYHKQLEGFKKNYTWCPYVQILPIIGADQNVYACHDKAYNKDTGILGSIKDQSFKDFWYDGREKFFKINPSRDCNHHCITDPTNKMIFEFLNVNHREFV